MVLVELCTFPPKGKASNSSLTPSPEFPERNAYRTKDGGTRICYFASIRVSKRLIYDVVVFVDQIATPFFVAQQPTQLLAKQPLPHPSSESSVLPLPHPASVQSR